MAHVGTPSPQVGISHGSWALMRALDARPWATRGACRDQPLDLFFYRSTPYQLPKEEAELRKIRRAKSICALCPVRAECREYAVVADCVGVWGGEDDVDRREERRRRGLLANRPAAGSMKKGYKLRKKGESAA